MKLFIQRLKVNTNVCDTQITFKWILNVKKMMRQIEEMLSNGIRGYFMQKIEIKKELQVKRRALGAIISLDLSGS